MKRVLGCVVVAGAAVALLVLALREAWVTDDALISFRYVQNLVAGHGLVYNIGERVEGFSNPPRVGALVPFGVARVNLFRAPVGVGLACALAEVVLLGWLAWKVTGSPWLAGLAAGLFASDRIVYVWTTGGLETAMHGLLLFAAFALAVKHRRAPGRGVVAVSLLCAALALSRPEGGIFYPLYAAHLYLAGRGDKSWRSTVARSLNWFLPVIGVALLIRFAHYGALVANPFRAKMSWVPTLGFGVGYLQAFARRLCPSGLLAIAWVLLAIATLRATVERRGADEPCRAPLAMALPVFGAQCVAVLAMGGDYMNDFRFLRPPMGVLYFAVACALAMVHEAGPRIVKWATLALAAALAASHLYSQRLATPMFADAPPSAEHKRQVSATQPQADRFRQALLSFAEPADAQLADKSGMMGFGHAIRTVDCTGLLSKPIGSDFYLRDEFAETHARERLPGHARWPTVDYLQRERFTFVFAKVNRMPPEQPEINPRMPRRTREYPFLHVTVPLDGGEFFRFFTTLDEQQVRERARHKHLAVCTRRPWGPLDCTPGG